MEPPREPNYETPWSSFEHRVRSMTDYARLIVSVFGLQRHEFLDRVRAVSFR